MTAGASTPIGPTATLTMAGSVRDPLFVVGRRLEATVVRVNVDGDVRVRIGNATVNATVNATDPAVLRAGERITLEVTSVAPQVVLRIQSEGAIRSPVSSGLREALANQLHHADAYSRLASVREGLPPAIQRRIDQILGAAIRPGSPVGDVQRAAKQSGLFLENHLAAETTASSLDRRASLSGDLKAEGLRLIRDIEQIIAQRGPDAALAEAKGAAEGLLARLSALQLLQLNAWQNGSTHWQLPLPLARDDGDGFDDAEAFVEVEQDESSINGIVMLRLAPPDLGEMVFRIALQQGVMHIGVWADRADTQQVLATQLHRLNAALQRRDVSVGSVHLLNQAPAIPSNAPSERLVDVSV